MQLKHSQAGEMKETELSVNYQTAHPCRSVSQWQQLEFKMLRRKVNHPLITRLAVHFQAALVVGVVTGSNEKMQHTGCTKFKWITGERAGNVSSWLRSRCFWFDADLQPGGYLKVKIALSLLFLILLFFTINYKWHLLTSDEKTWKLICCFHNKFTIFYAVYTNTLTYGGGD